MEKLIATYLESRLELRRRFDLFPDSIRVSGGGLFYPRFEQTIPLTALSPIRGRVWVRGRLFTYGLWTLVAVAVACAMNFAVGASALLTQPWFLGAFGSTACVGLVLVAIRIRPVEYASFQGNAGITLVDVARVGPQTEQFEDFVALLARSIHAAMLKTSLPPIHTLPRGAIELSEEVGGTFYISPTPPPAAPKQPAGSFRSPPPQPDAIVTRQGQGERRFDPALGGDREEREDISNTPKRTLGRPDEPPADGLLATKAILMAHPLRPLMVSAARLLRSKDYRATLALLEPVIERDEDANRPSPISGLLWAMAGDCYFELSEPDKGFRAYRRAMELDGNTGCLALFACQVASHRRAEYAEEGLRALRANRLSLWRAFRRSPILTLWYMNWEFLSLCFFHAPRARWRLRRMVARAKG